MSKNKINYRKAQYFISKSLERVDYILKFDKGMQNQGYKKDQYFYTNILLYESCLCKFCNVGECLSNQAYSKKERIKNKQSINVMYSKISNQSLPRFRHNLMHQLMVKILSIVEFNPFFLGNLQFIGIKHEQKYFDKIERRGDYDYFHYCFIKEILDRCVFSSSSETITFFNSIKTKLNWADKDLYSFCRETFSYYGLNFQWYFGLVYDSDFRDIGEKNEIIKLKKIKLFLRKIFLIIGEDKTLIENNLYNLGSLAFTNKKRRPKSKF